MATVRLRNINPLGYVDLPLIGRQAGSSDVPGEGDFEAEGVSCLVPGEVFEVDEQVAEQLLEQVGNYELVKPKKSAAHAAAADSEKGGE